MNNFHNTCCRSDLSLWLSTWTRWTFTSLVAHPQTSEDVRDSVLQNKSIINYRNAYAGCGGGCRLMEMGSIMVLNWIWKRFLMRSDGVKPKRAGQFVNEAKRCCGFGFRCILVISRVDNWQRIFDKRASASSLPQPSRRIAFFCLTDSVSSTAFRIEK